MPRAKSIAVLFSALCLASRADAGITVQLIVYNEIGTSPNATLLENAGYQMVRVVAVADFASGDVFRFDFRNGAPGLPGIPGIYGKFLQRYRDLDGEGPGDFEPTPVGSSANGGLPNSVHSFPDTHWINLPAYIGTTYYHPDAPLVDHLHYNSPFADEVNDPGTPNIDRDAITPLTDDDFSDWGFGGEMHGAGTIGLAAQTPSRILATLIVPGDSLYDIGIVGRLWGTKDPDTAHLIILNPIPEPASLTLVALGALALLARRRQI